MNTRRFLLTWLPILAITGCVHLPRVAPVLRSQSTRAASVVHVEAYCGSWSARSGSGVIISGRHVLTATHIVGCANLPTVRVTYIDDTGQERRLRMVVTKEDQDTNIAKLEIASAEVFDVTIKPPVVRSPDPGDDVCANRGGARVACGEVASTWTVVKRMETNNDDFGAPVYCDRGTLVGIVVNRGSSDAFPYSWIAPIDDRWLDGIVPDQPTAETGMAAVTARR